MLLEISMLFVLKLSGISCPPELRVAQIKTCTHGSHVTLQNYIYKWIVIVHTDYGWLIQKSVHMDYM